jgi:hypothetical protein
VAETLAALPSVADAPALASFTLEAVASEVVLAEVLREAVALAALAAEALAEVALVVVGNYLFNVFKLV